MSSWWFIGDCAWYDPFENLEEETVHDVSDTIQDFELRQLCCDEYKMDCVCEFPMSWEAIKSYAEEIYDNLGDCYEHSVAFEEASHGRPSCKSCIHFAEASCGPLRIALYTSAVLGSRHSPISMCSGYEKDAESFALYLM